MNKPTNVFLVLVGVFLHHKLEAVFPTLGDFVSIQLRSFWVHKKPFSIEHSVALLFHRA